MIGEKYISLLKFVSNKPQYFLRIVISMFLFMLVCYIILIFNNKKTTNNLKNTIKEIRESGEKERAIIEKKNIILTDSVNYWRKSAQKNVTIAVKNVGIGKQKIENTLKKNQDEYDKKYNDVIGTDIDSTIIIWKRLHSIKK